MAANKKFGSWEMLTMYLQMHPANPEQAFVARENITWMMLIRMARNVFCHEQYMNWTLLKEFDGILQHYFNTRQNIAAVFDTIHRHCFVPPLSRVTSCQCTAVNCRALRYLEVPRIQYHEPDNICMLQCCASHLPRPVVGLTPIQALIDKLTRPKFKSFTKVILISGYEREKMLALVASYLNDINVEYNVIDSMTWSLKGVHINSHAITVVLTSVVNVIAQLLEREHEKTKAVKSSVLVKQLHSVNSELFSAQCVRDIERVARHLGGVPKHAFRTFNVEFPFISLPALALSDILFDTASLHSVISTRTKAMLREANGDLVQLKQRELNVELLPYIGGSLVLNRAMKQFTAQAGRCYYLQDQCLTLLLLLDTIGGDTLRTHWLEILTSTDDTTHLELLNDIALCLPLYACTKDRLNSNVEETINNMVEDTLLTYDPDVNYARVLFDECAVKIRTAETWQSVTAFSSFVASCLRDIKFKTLLNSILMTIREEF
jgi:hypothetical protein